MKHFEINEWADYVRGLGSASALATMKTHLDTGCRRCQNIVRTFEKLVSTIAADRSPEVPVHLVREAEALFALHRPEKVTFAHKIASLVHDSFRTPLPAGVRSQRAATRQALYHAGDFCVDVRIEHERGGRSVSLTGQLANTKSPEMALRDLPVSLMSGRQLLARTTTNQFGEFQLHYQPKGRVRLHLPIKPAGQWIEVPLGELSQDEEPNKKPSEKKLDGKGQEQ